MKLILFFVCFSFSRYVYSEDVDKKNILSFDKDFIEVLLITKEITRRFPPSQFIYITVGKSLTPISALLHVMGHEVVNLPFTKGNQWDPDKHGEYFSEHLSEFLPSVTELFNKKILFLDYVVNGSFRKFLTMLKDFESRNKSYNGKFDYLCFITEYNRIGHEEWIFSNNRIDPKKYYLLHQDSIWNFNKKLIFSEYKPYSEYLDSFEAPANIHSKYIKPSKNNMYLELIIEIKNMYQRYLNLNSYELNSLCGLYLSGL